MVPLKLHQVRCRGPPRERVTRRGNFLSFTGIDGTLEKTSSRIQVMARGACKLDLPKNRLSRDTLPSCSGKFIVFYSKIYVEVRSTVEYVNNAENIIGAAVDEIPNSDITSRSSRDLICREQTLIPLP